MPQLGLDVGGNFAAYDMTDLWYNTIEPKKKD